MLVGVCVFDIACFNCLLCKYGEKYMQKLLHKGDDNLLLYQLIPICKVTMANTDVFIFARPCCG